VIEDLLLVHPDPVQRHRGEGVASTSYSGN
jgi:hypothetical protein